MYLETFLYGLNPLNTVLFSTLLFVLIFLFCTLTICMVSVIAKKTLYGSNVKALYLMRDRISEVDKAIDDIHSKEKSNSYVLSVDKFIDFEFFGVNGDEVALSRVNTRKDFKDIVFESNLIAKKLYSILDEEGKVDYARFILSTSPNIDSEMEEINQINAKVYKDCYAAQIDNAERTKLLSLKTKEVRKRISLKISIAKKLEQKQYTETVFSAFKSNHECTVTFSHLQYSEVVSIRSDCFYDKEIMRTAHGKKGRKKAKEALMKMREMQNSPKETQLEQNALPIVEQSVEATPSASTQPQQTLEQNIVHVDFDALEQEEQSVFQNQWEEDPQYG